MARASRVGPAESERTACLSVGLHNLSSDVTEVCSTSCTLVQSYRSSGASSTCSKMQFPQAAGTAGCILGTPQGCPPAQSGTQRPDASIWPRAWQIKKRPVAVLCPKSLKPPTRRPAMQLFRGCGMRPLFGMQRRPQYICTSPMRQVAQLVTLDAWHAAMAAIYGRVWETKPCAWCTAAAFIF